MSKMRLSNYERSMLTHDEETITAALTPLEKLTRVQIPGKRGRTVPVLLTTAMKRATDLLLSTKRKAGIAEENTFY